MDEIERLEPDSRIDQEEEFQGSGKRTSPPSARETARSAIKHEILLNTLKVFIKLS